MLSMDSIKEDFEKELKKYMEDNDYTRIEALNALQDDLYYYGISNEKETVYKSFIDEELKSIIK